MPMFRPAPQILGPVSILSSLRAEKHSNSLKWLKMIIENRITISTESQAESYMTSEEVLAVIWNSMLYSATHSVGCCKNWRGHRPTWSGQAISFWIWLNGHTANAVSTGLGTASGVSGLIDMGLSPVVGGASPVKNNGEDIERYANILRDKYGLSGSEAMKVVMAMAPSCKMVPRDGGDIYKSLNRVRRTGQAFNFAACTMIKMMGSVVVIAAFLTDLYKITRLVSSWDEQRPAIQAAGKAFYTEKPQKTSVRNEYQFLQNRLFSKVNKRCFALIEQHNFAG